MNGYSSFNPITFNIFYVSMRFMLTFEHLSCLHRFTCFDFNVSWETRL